MDIRLCDICKKREAVKKFKIKEWKPVIQDGLHTMRWVKMDVCEYASTGF